jgi:dihydrofolate synthase/folylpolyglutamate synthase
MRSQAKWIESLSPWPDEFGLERMQTLLTRIGDPQHAYPAIHVVGTNGKSTTARMTEELLAADGLKVGAYLSPHVAGWSERIRVGGAEADFEHVISRVRPAAEAIDATQFEVLTAAALAEFADAGVDVAVVEAGLGGRLDATNVLDSRVVVLTNVALEHTDVLGTTREAIAAEKLAVVRTGSTVVLGEREWEQLAYDSGAERVVAIPARNVALAVAAAQEFLGRPVDAGPAQHVQLPGRLERRAEAPLEIWDGAHNLAGVGHVLARLPARRYVIVASILADKDVDGMLAALAALGDTFIATQSSSGRAVAASELARHARARFASVEALDDPAAAVVRARQLAGREGAVLVTGSLYLLADLHRDEREGEGVRWRTLVTG